MLAWEGTAWGQARAGQAAARKKRGKEKEGLGLEEDDLIQDIQPIQSVNASVLGDIEALRRDHAGNDGGVSLAGLDSKSDPVLGLGQGYFHEAFVGNGGIGVGGFPLFPDFDALNLHHFLGGTSWGIGFLGESGKGAQCDDEK